MDGSSGRRRTDSAELLTLDPRTLEPLEPPLATAGSAPKLVPGTDWLISREPSGTLRLDHLHPPSPTAVLAEPGRSSAGWPCPGAEPRRLTGRQLSPGV
ncbi:MAG: hypothetical protein AMXMBFR33_57020 [Candidatus Xenobia bacterium]